MPGKCNDRLGIHINIQTILIFLDMVVPSCDSLAVYCVNVAPTNKKLRDGVLVSSFNDEDDSA